MHIFSTAAKTFGFILLSNPWFILAQEDVDQCTLNCVANVNGTNCAKAQWNCLCADRTYFERVNNCTYAACNKTDEDTTFAALNQTCRVFGYTLTYGPEATAPTSSDQIFSTQGILSESSLPAVLSSTISDFPIGSDGYTIATAPPSPSSVTSTSAASVTMSTSPSSSSATSGSASAAVVTSSSGADRNNFGLAFAVAVGANMLCHH